MLDLPPDIQVAGAEAVFRTTLLGLGLVHLVVEVRLRRSLKHVRCEEADASRQGRHGMDTGQLLGFSAGEHLLFPAGVEAIALPVGPLEEVGHFTAVTDAGTVNRMGRWATVGSGNDGGDALLEPLEGEREWLVQEQLGGWVLAVIGVWLIVGVQHEQHVAASSDGFLDR